MKKIVFVLGLFVILAANCKKDDEPVEDINYEEQVIKDNDSLVKYLTTHYLDENKQLQKITSGQTPVMDLVTSQKIKNKIVTLNNDTIEVEATLYYIILQQGVNKQAQLTDSVNVSYRGMLLDHTIFDRNDYGMWAESGKFIKGFTTTLLKLKAGNWSTATDGSHVFTDNGKAILFMPSALGYANRAQTKIPANSPLIFYINLNLAKDADWDGDGILSVYEDLNNNGDFTDDDTDADKYYNYYDVDDDGDGTLTKNENADPNKDRNPIDAKDTDNDGTPDYLDKDTK